MPDQSTYIKPGTVCPGEIFLGNPFLIYSSLNVKDFVAQNIERLSSTDFCEIHAKKTSTKVGKFGLKVISQQVIADASDSLDDSHHSRSSQLCSMKANSNFPLKDGDDIDYEDVKVGEQDTEELETTIQNMIDRAAKKLSRDLCPTLQEMVMSCKDILRIRLGNDPPVYVPPIPIEFEGTERSIKVRQRTYSPEQLTFLKKKVGELEKPGYVYQNNCSKWTCAPLIVPKTGKEGIRFTVDLWRINA